jgi:hypothetical protein
MADPGSGSIDLLTALDLLGKAEARVAELEAALEKIAGAPQPRLGAMGANSMRHTARAALAAVRQEKP